MKHPWQVWLVFVACIIGAAGAMVWLTQQAVRTDEARRAAQAETVLEQRASLALWRMDTELAPIVAAEVIRAPSMYRSAFQFANGRGPAQQMGMFQPPNMPAVAPVQQDTTIQQPAAFGQQAAVPPEPSLLFVEPPPYVVCNFEVTLDGQWRSPQVPEPQWQALAAANGVSPEALSERTANLRALAAAVDVRQLAAELPVASLPSLADVNDNNKALVNADSISQVTEFNRGLNYFAGNTGKPTNVMEVEPGSAAGALPETPLVKGGKGDFSQMASRAADYDERNRRYQSVAQQGILEQRQQQSRNTIPNLPPADDVTAKIGVSRPVWVGERLLLVRRVEQANKSLVQGCWLDWPKLKTRLLAEAVELVPGADLVAVPDVANADPGRMLAGLPVRLTLAAAPAGGDAMLSPTLRWALWIGWGALVLAAAAATALLAGVMALSERRAAFVSSVTHELRTPLTTFRMYSEMLARGMVPDAGRRQEYLHTLEREAVRLTHLVENVLAYARLERGRRPSASDHVTPAALLDRIGSRLAKRAEHGGMTCEIEIDEDAADARLTTDQGVVEQILFNLVDNAAKYARAATDRRIHVNAIRDGRWLKLVVRDHGPGMPRRRASRLRPFAKTAEESAETAPGVGLGLALCGRLARQLGGRLEIATDGGGGAAVTLILPTND